MKTNKNPNRNYPRIAVPLTPILNQREKTYSPSRFPFTQWLLFAVLAIDLHTISALNNTNTSNHYNSDLRHEKTIPKVKIITS